MPSFREILKYIFSSPSEKRVSLTLAESESIFMVGSSTYDASDRDRMSFSREETLDDCFTAWRDSALARRIVELTTQYVVGTGFDIKIDDDKCREFVDQFWAHRLNRMRIRCMELCDELTRSGNLFLLISTDQSGMSYVRTIPPTDIVEITATSNDIEQPLSFSVKQNDSLDPKIYPAYNPDIDVVGEDGSFLPVVIHYAINRPAGGQWGESELAPLLPWLRRYTAFLEDRVRLNRFRNAFMFVVSADFPSEEARLARQTQLAANPPSSGSILVTDNSETWSVIAPKLEALDAETDGMAIKKLISAGAGIPLHFLAEPEGTNRTTAESAGGPTFRRYEQRQQYFMWMLGDLIKMVIQRRAQIDRTMKNDPLIEVSGGDISARDNVAHSIATVNMLNALERLYNMGSISKREVMRVAYRFSGEQADIDKLMEEGTGIDLRETIKPIQPASTDPVDTTSGAPKKSTIGD
jgi:hypothetical protein